MRMRRGKRVGPVGTLAAAKQVTKLGEGIKLKELLVYRCVCGLDLRFKLP